VRSALVVLATTANLAAYDRDQTAAAAPVDTCVIAATIVSFDPSASGLLIRATAPITPRIVDMRSVHESGFAELSIVTIDVPRAALDGAARGGD